MRKTILIVDDNHATLATLGRRLAQAGFVALLSDDRDEAASLMTGLMAGRTVDCVLLTGTMATAHPTLRPIAGVPVIAEPIAASIEIPALCARIGRLTGADRAGVMRPQARAMTAQPVAA